MRIVLTVYWVGKQKVYPPYGKTCSTRTLLGGLTECQLQMEKDCRCQGGILDLKDHYRFQNCQNIIHENSVQFKVQCLSLNLKIIRSKSPPPWDMWTRTSHSHTHKSNFSISIDIMKRQREEYYLS